MSDPYHLGSKHRHLNSGFQFSDVMACRKKKGRTIIHQKQSNTTKVDKIMPLVECVYIYICHPGKNLYRPNKCFVDLFLHGNALHYRKNVLVK